MVMARRIMHAVSALHESSVVLVPLNEIFKFLIDACVVLTTLIIVILRVKQRRQKIVELNDLGSGVGHATDLRCQLLNGPAFNAGHPGFQQRASFSTRLSTDLAIKCLQQSKALSRTSGCLATGSTE